MSVTNPEKLGQEIREREAGFKDQNEVKNNIAKMYTKGAIIDMGGDLIRIESFNKNTGEMKGKKITSNKTIEELSRPAGKIDEANLDGREEYVETNLVGLVGDLEKPSMENLPKVVPENELAEKIGNLMQKTQEEHEELKESVQKAENNKAFLKEHESDWDPVEFEDFRKKAEDEHNTFIKLEEAKKRDLESLKSFVDINKIEVKGYAM